jgi:hypothetical protein
MTVPMNAEVSQSFGRNAKKSEHAVYVDDECNAMSFHDMSAMPLYWAK